MTKHSPDCIEDEIWLYCRHVGSFLMQYEQAYSDPDGFQSQAGTLLTTYSTPERSLADVSKAADLLSFAALRFPEREHSRTVLRHLREIPMLYRNGDHPRMVEVRQHANEIMRSYFQPEAGS